MLVRYPAAATERESAMYAKMTVLAEANQPKLAQDVGNEYLKEFPNGANVDTVGYLLGATALQQNDAAGAETYFGRMLGSHKASPLANEMRFMLANARFAQEKFADAVGDYERYLKDFPNDGHAEECLYRIGLASVFSGKYEEAIGKINAYLAKYPQGNFATDAKYRLAVCMYAASQYDEVIARTQAWQKEYPNDQLLGEVLALQADAQAAQNKNDDAIANYLRSWKTATSAEVLNYSLFAAQKLLQKKGDWEGMGKMFQDFLDAKPGDPNAVMAVYWIAKVKVREGKAEEARAFVAKTILENLDDPKNDAVEQLITQFVTLVAHQRPVVVATPSPSPMASPGASPTAVVSATPVATPAPTPVDVLAEINQLLGASAKSDPAQARLHYARAELARLKKQPVQEDAEYQAIADQIKPEALSPLLLARTADYLLGKNKNDQAASDYKLLMELYPKASVLDYAYNGLGRIAYLQQRYQEAFGYYDDAINKIGATEKLKDVSLGRARALLALGRKDEAHQQFEQVASTREWRGECTAEAVYSLGEIQFAQGKYAEANAFYQRVYVAYQRFPEWMAKAYARSAECFEKLGKKQEEINTYREMVKNDRLSAREETTAARKRLQELAGGTAE
ncbi:MAG: tetratricopeptide repeat protein [Chthoniobacteraceae bacterium]